jgi:quinol monooxygenase YgiN
MDVLIVSFKLESTSAADWEEQATQLAPKFAAMPDLLSKVWIADPDTNTYGGAYLWRDRASLDAYLAGPVFGALSQLPDVHSIETRTFAALDAPTRISIGAVAATGR